MTVAAEEKKYTVKDFASDQDVRWCPGCGDYSILAAMKITDELFRSRAEAAGLDQKVRERLVEVTARLEGALKF